VAGRDLALGRDGKPEIRQTGERVPWATIDALLRQQWISCAPGYPLLNPPARVTERGRLALDL
jgi:hypothetical protein